DADLAFARIRAASRQALDRIDASCLQIASLTHRARPREAVALGLEALADLGTRLPADLAQAIEHGLDQLQHADAGDTASSREAGAADVIAVAKLLDRLVIPTLQCDAQVNAWLALESHRLWIRHGVCAALVRSMALSLPLVLQGRRQAYGAAHAIATRLIAAGEQRGYGGATATARHVHAIATQHWFGALEHSVSEARRAHDELLRAGDLQFACLTFNATAPALLDSAPTLRVCADEVQAGLAFAVRTGNQFAQGMYLSYRQLLRALGTPGQSEGSFQSDDFDEQERISGHLAVGTIGALFHILRALSAAIFDDTPRLLAHTSAARPLLATIPGFYPTVWAQVLRALALCGELRAPAAAPRDAALRCELDAIVAWLHARSADQPGNFAHLARWIDAEAAWACDDGLAALRAFEAAVATVDQRPRAWQRALIAERAAACCSDQGLAAMAGVLLRKAHALYRDWGAHAKCAALALRHPWLAEAGGASRGNDQGAAPDSSSRLPAAGLPGQEIDLLAVVRAAQVLSSETSLVRLTQRVSQLMAAMTGATGVRLLVDQGGDWVAAADGEVATAPALPVTALRYAERTRAALLVADACEDDRFRSDPYFKALERCALLVLPVLHQNRISALVLLENRLSGAGFAPQVLQPLQLVAGQLAVSLQNATLYGELESRVAERTRELREAQARLVDTARRAGMAEIATNVLHNVGNVLNSVNVSADLVGSRLRASKAGGLVRAVALIREHEHALGDFFSQDEKGRRLPDYLDRLAQTLVQEQAGMLTELEQLTRRIGHIKEVVATQQSYAGNSTVREVVRMQTLVDDAVQMTEASMVRHGVHMDVALDALPDLLLDRPRVLQILVNLLANAKNACSDAGRCDGVVTLAAMQAGSELCIRVSDNGVGIAAENLEKVFAHGFTTRSDGHGFGLHSCVLAAREMGGSLVARSAGAGQGASFELSIPFTPALP
ncbi:MAG: GAF domain-containing protein, partial [Pseudomonadota bacterium]|nr:GAF domain-containing protein [Pseudomonadota bacterium]